MWIRDIYFQNLGIDQRTTADIGSEIRALNDYLKNSISHLDYRNYGLEFEVLEQFDYSITRLSTVLVPEGQIIELRVGEADYDERISLLGEGNKVVEHHVLRKEKDRILIRLAAKARIDKPKRLFHGMNEVNWTTLDPPVLRDVRELNDANGQSIPLVKMEMDPGGLLLVLDTVVVPDRIFCKSKELFFHHENSARPKSIGKKMVDDLGALEPISVQKKEGIALIRLSRELKGHLRDEEGNYYRYLVKERAAEEGHWLTLKEPKDQQDDTVSDSNKIDIFFTMLGEEDESQIVEMLDKNGKPVPTWIKVIGVDREERKIKVERLPSPSTTVIYPRDNSSQLKKQLDAVRTLSEHPSGDQLSLIRLFVRREKVDWPLVIPRRGGIPWRFLTDEGRDGNQEQRDFVLAGLSTPDFVLLEGPPGSGKTTAISELVYQILTSEENRGKKILLCAPTHVAVDNVISKMIERFGSLQGLMDNGVVPLRLGREEGRVDEDLRSLHIKRRMQKMSALFKQEEWFNALPSRASAANGTDGSNRRSELLDQEKVLEDAVINSSNLICGTTIGILSLPIFEERRKGFRHAFFDYMIIDEASKTTLTEFLVPAVKSKKWIIVGDVRQLAPSVDILGLRVNLDCKLEDRLRQRALLLFLKLFFNQEAIFRDGRKQLPPRFIYPASNEEINVLVQELPAKLAESAQHRAQRIREGKGGNLVPTEQFRKNVVIITDMPYRNCGEQILKIGPEELGDRYLEVLSAYLVVVDRRFYPLLKDRLPLTHILLDLESPPDGHVLNDYSFQSWSRFMRNEGRPVAFHRERGGDTDDLPIILDDLTTSLNRTWGSELAWRLKRVYELRSSKGLSDALEDSTGKYNASIRALMPSQRDFYGRILNYAKVSLPSVITCLQEGVFRSAKEDEPRTVLSHGFPREALDGRFHVLTFQHRMHPEISEVARDIFYKTEDGVQRLTDSRSVRQRPDHSGERDWPINVRPLYESRFAWIDVPNGTDQRNVNHAEVGEVLNELDQVIRWLKANSFLGKKPEDWTVMIVSFYEAQRRAIRDRLRKYTGMTMSESRFVKDEVRVYNYTVDMVQGREADFVLMTLSRTRKIGFMDCPNRINVAITRARYQQVIIGKANFFRGRGSCAEWRAIVDRVDMLGG